MLEASRRRVQRGCLVQAWKRAHEVWAVEKTSLEGTKMMVQKGCSQKSVYHSSISELVLLLVYSPKQMKAEKDYLSLVLEQELSVSVIEMDSLASTKKTVQRDCSV